MLNDECNSVAVAVVIAFFICWAPFHVQRLIAIYGTNAEDHISSNSKLAEFLYLLFTYISGVLYYVSTSINPILYNIMSNKFRVAFMVSTIIHSTYYRVIRWINQLEQFSRYRYSIVSFLWDETLIALWINQRYVHGGKKSLSVAVVDEFYTFDLMEIRVKNLPQNWLWSWI